MTPERNTKMEDSEFDIKKVLNLCYVIAKEYRDNPSDDYIIEKIVGFIDSNNLFFNKYHKPAPLDLEEIYEAWGLKFNYNHSLPSAKETIKFVIDHLHQTNRLSHVPEWQPIETAPKDGTFFIGYSPTHKVKQNIKWSSKRQDFDLNGWSGLKRDWTHWMPQKPLPPPPIAAAEEVE